MTTTTGNGSSNGHSCEGSRLKRAKYTALQTVMDIIVFVVTSLLHIAQALVWAVAGKRQKSLEGGVALVTGGGGGLGRLLAMRLARLRCIVILWDINKEGLDETVKLVTSMGGTCKGYLVDLANRQDVYRAAALVKADYGRVTLLINNAGLVSGTTLLKTPDHLIQRTFDVNILAHFWTTKAFLPDMVSSQDGHIVTIASMAGHVGVAKLVDYCSTKFAAVGFDEALRAELEAMAVQGVHTTVICPFFIRSTGMFEDVHSRFVPQLNSNDVADRIIKAVRCNEKFAIIPGYLQILLAIKWMFPWGCVSGFLSRLVPDAVPDDTSALSSPAPAATQTSQTSQGKNDLSSNEMPVRRTITTERQP